MVDWIRREIMSEYKKHGGLSGKQDLAFTILAIVIFVIVVGGVCMAGYLLLPG